ncbi:MAG TPA: hypothetical protein VFS21_15325 [Roseiflexaceae bacterium]|nr:hypothetical protein [Roseiflexaceae bacterium]
MTQQQTNQWVARMLARLRRLYSTHQISEAALHRWYVRIWNEFGIAP